MRFVQTTRVVEKFTTHDFLVLPEFWGLFHGYLQCKLFEKGNTSCRGNY